MFLFLVLYGRLVWLLPVFERNVKIAYHIVSYRNSVINLVHKSVPNKTVALLIIIIENKTACTNLMF